MIKRFYVHNFKCLENFELSVSESSSLIIGKNGVGKSSIREAFELLQKIGRGISSVEKIISPENLSRGRLDSPVRFEIHVLLDGQDYEYAIAFELPEKFTKLRIKEEILNVSGINIFKRKEASVSLNSSKGSVQFSMDWHSAALPLIHSSSEKEPISIFRNFLAKMIILSPIPALISGNAKGETLEINKDGANFCEWLSGILARYPASYMIIYNYLKEGIFPDMQDFRSEKESKDSQNWSVSFKKSSEFQIDFGSLSDGEKCFFLCAAVLAAHKYMGPLFCFWDEPDNHLSLSEVRYFITELRKAFSQNGQLLTTSHHPEAIKTFSRENIYLVHRKSHLEPTQIHSLNDISYKGDLIENLILGELEEYGN